MVTLGKDLITGQFLKREKKFTAFVRLGSRVTRVFLSQTGRLEEVLKVGTPVVLRPAPHHSKLPFEMLLAYDGPTPVIVDSRIANLVVGEALEDHAIPSLPYYSMVVREKKVGNHRIDFLLRNHSRIFLEVKGCTLKVKSSIIFPDAPTERGREHLRLLSRLQSEGSKTMVIFLAMRSDVNSFKVNSAMDPEFAILLSEAVKGGTRIASFATDFSDGRAKIGRRLRLFLN